MKKMKRKLSIAVMLIVAGVKNTMAQTWGNAGDHVIEFMREMWPVFILVIIVGGGVIAIFTDAFGKNRDFLKPLTYIVLSVAMIALIMAAYARVKTQNVI